MITKITQILLIFAFVFPAQIFAANPVCEVLNSDFAANPFPLRLTEGSRFFSPYDELRGVQILTDRRFEIGEKLTRSQMESAQRDLLNMAMNAIGQKIEAGRITLSKPLSQGYELALHYEVPKLQTSHSPTKNKYRLIAIDLVPPSGLSYRLTSRPLEDSGQNLLQTSWVWKTQIDRSTTERNPTETEVWDARQLLSLKSTDSQPTLQDQKQRPGDVRDPLNLAKQLVTQVAPADRPYLDGLSARADQLSLPLEISDPKMVAFLETWMERLSVLKPQDGRPIQNSGDQRRFYARYLFRNGVKCIADLNSKYGVKVVVMAALLLGFGKIASQLFFMGRRQVLNTIGLEKEDSNSEAPDPILVLSPALIRILQQIDPRWKEIDGKKPKTPELKMFRKTPGEFQKDLQRLSGGPQVFEKTEMTVYAGSTDLSALTEMRGVNPVKTALPGGTLIFHLKTQGVVVVSHWPDLQEIRPDMTVEYVLLKEAERPLVFQRMVKILSEGYQSSIFEPRVIPDPK